MPNSSDNYDLVIIGGGPAGVNAGITAAEVGKRVVIIDNHRELGGAGVNTGTVPSKTLRETALALSGLKSRALYGVDLSLRREVTVQDFLKHEEHVRDGFHTSLNKRLTAAHAEVLWGDCTFADAHTVNVQLYEADEASKRTQAGQRQLHADKILVATGSSPVRPGLFPFGQGEIYDSDSILMLDRIPKTMAVVGAGTIGAEYACTFRALGTDVHILDGRADLLPFLDKEVSAALLKALEESGIKLHWKTKVGQCVAQADGSVQLKLDSGDTLTVGAVLVAAGRQSNTGTLGLEKAGVTTGNRGIVPVNENYQTNVENIYAAGDVIGFPALASTSIEQARRAVRHALGLPKSALSPLLPNGIYTIPEVSMVGDTEESLQKKGVAYVVGKGRYEDNGRGRIIGDESGFLKLLFRAEDMRLTGVHIIGELATEVVHIGLMAMMCNAAAELFVDASFNIPTLGALYKAATLDALRNRETCKPSSAPAGAARN